MSMNNLLSKKIVYRTLSCRNTQSKVAKQTDVSDFFTNHYEEVIEALVSDSDIITEILEQMINLNRLSVHEGQLFYKNKRLLT